MRGNMDNNILFSNYLEIFAYRDEFAIFNKMNGALVLLSPENIRQNSSKQWVCTSTDNRTLSYLKENLFFVSNEYVQKLIYDADHPNTNYNDVLLIVGTTERCSCGCSYCYELDWPKTDSLPSSDYIDWIFEYICEIMEHADNDANITIKYFGGEPLLCSNIIKEINEKINNFTNKTSKKLNIHYQMDSNCILLTREIFSLFPNLKVSTTLSLQPDHDSLRSGSYQNTIENLLAVSDLFKLPQYKLVIGYNIHHGNVSDFPEFLQQIKKLGLNCQFDVQNIVNHESVPFTNHLSNKEFSKLYCDLIIPSLIENGYDIQILPPHGIQRKCNGVNILNRRFFANGTQALCPYFKKEDIRGPHDYPVRIKPQSYLQPLPPMCIQCYDFPYCGGLKPCIHCDGQYRGRDEMVRRIKLYLDLQSAAKKRS